LLKLEKKANPEPDGLKRTVLTIQPDNLDSGGRRKGGTNQKGVKRGTKY